MELRDLCSYPINHALFSCEGLYLVESIQEKTTALLIFQPGFDSMGIFISSALNH